MGRPKCERIKRICLQCGSDFETLPCYMRKGEVKFCSRSCATIYKNIHDNPSKKPEVRKKISENHADVSGENNPMFGRRGADAPSYIDGRKKAIGSKSRYEKVMWVSQKEQKCSQCGKKEKLNIHHIDKNHKNDNIDNLLYLCTKCHYLEHEKQRDLLGRFKGGDCID